MHRAKPEIHSSRRMPVGEEGTHLATFGSLASLSAPCWSTGLPSAEAWHEGRSEDGQSVRGKGGAPGLHPRSTFDGETHSGRRVA